MKGYDTPLVDDQNPLYCPSIPAVSFLESIRQQLHEPSTANVTHTSNRSPSSDDYMLPSFARLLDKSVTADDLLELLYHPPGLKFEDSDSSTSSELNDNTEGSMVLAGLDAPVKQADSFGLPETFSDIKGPVKREMSQASMNEGSFELSAKADRLLYFVRGGSYSPYPAKSRRYPHRPPRNQNHEWRVKVYELQDRIYILEDELYGTAVGTETPRGMKTLVSRLDDLLPGIRLKSKLSVASSHQDIADILCLNGCVNTRVLNVLRTSEIEFLDLTPSMAEEGGLNLDARDMLQVFSKPNSFLFLNEINLCGAVLRDSDIMYLHHLPRLARLWLKGTSIGNEAVFLLLPLKRSLYELDVADNPAIDDDVIVVFLVLSKLLYLALGGTSVSMVGVRRLASALGPRGQDMEVEVPDRCEEYLRKISRKYILSPDPPLITDPRTVQNLTTDAVIQNLAAHSVVNPDIPTQGPRSLLVKHLEELLETREADIQARHLIHIE